MRPSPPDTDTLDRPDIPDDVVVEAGTAEEAIAEVHARLGEDARILRADKVLRGGRWGFFQKQVVQLTARPADTSAPAGAPTPSGAPGPRSVPAPEAPGGLEAVLARLSAAEDDEELDLGSALRRHLGVQIAEDGPRAAVTSTPAAAPDASSSAGPAVPASAPTGGWQPPSVAPTSHRLAGVTDGEPSEVPTGLAAALATRAEPGGAVGPIGSEPMPDAAPEVLAEAAPRVEEGLPLEDVEFSRASGTPWSGRGLLMLGLPRGFVDVVLAQEPADDAAWTYAVARALAPLCRPLPTGASVLAGPRAERLAKAVGAPLVRLTAAPRGRSTFAVACTDSGRARTWLATHRGQRWTHLVIGGSDWRGLLFEGPLAVSWVGEDALGDAIRTAHDLGMVLGPGVRDASGDVVEPAPIELAMLLRDLLGGRR